ncbi:hypothetical protein F4811DRAFT_211354 [Daldinia bambusicola]|nr:hypothetical protein F4811DRAFT_211354 [Daldinia bambusicola]
MDKIEVLPGIHITNDEDLDKLAEAVSKLESDLAHFVHDLSPLSSKEMGPLSKHLHATGRAFVSLLNAKVHERRQDNLDHTNINKINTALIKLKAVEKYLEDIMATNALG